MENPTEETKPTLPERNPVERLKDGVLLRYSQTELEYPNYYAMSAIHDEIKPLQDQWRYASEIIRVISELELTVWFLENRIPSEDELKDIPQKPEDIIIYHQGVFLELTHQLRDKILRLVALLLGEPAPKSKEGSETIIKRLVLAAEKQNALFTEELKAWSDAQPTRTGIITAMILRTNHHHQLSGLGLHSGFVDTKMSRMFQREATQKLLSPYGKEQMAAMGAVGFQNLLTTARKNADTTMKEIHSAVDALAEKLVTHFSLETTPEKYQALAEKQKAFVEQIKIENTCKPENIPTDLRPLLEDIKQVEAISNGGIVSVYIVGSIPRGENNELYSDINLILIVQSEELIETAKQAFPDKNFFIATQIFTEAEFVDKENLLATKYRFLCKYDGILVAGKELVEYEVFPRPSGELAWVLNHDFIGRIEEIETWMQENPNARQVDTGRISKRVAKLSIDIAFGVAMTNDPHYIHNRMHRIDFINAAFPANRKMMETLKLILLSGGCGDIESLKEFVEATKETDIHSLNQIEPLYKKLRSAK